MVVALPGDFLPRRRAVCGRSLGWQGVLVANFCGRGAVLCVSADVEPSLEYAGMAPTGSLGSVPPRRDIQSIRESALGPHRKAQSRLPVGVLERNHIAAGYSNPLGG